MHSTPVFAEVVIRGTLPPGLVVGCGLAATAAVTWFALTEPACVPAHRRVVLAALRATAVASVVALALHPAVVKTSVDMRPRPVVVLVDDSESMTATARRPDVSTTRLDIVKSALTDDRLRLLDRLTRVGPVQPVAFGSRPTAKDLHGSEWVSSLSGTEPRTALADAVAGLLKQDAGDLPAAVVIVSDGRDNSSHTSFAEVARESARLGVPLHVFGVGGASAETARILNVATPAVVFADDTVTVPVHYAIGEFEGGAAEVVVRLRVPGATVGREVARRSVPARPGEFRDVLTFVPGRSDIGGRELVTTVTVATASGTIAGETAVPVRVVDRKIKVLVVDSAPRWDFVFLQRMLLRDRRVEAKFYLFDADPRAMRAGGPFLPAFPTDRADLFAFDLLVLGDVPASALTADQQRFVREFVAEGGGLIHAAGRRAGPSSFVGTPLADVLPVEVEARSFPPADLAARSAYQPLPTAVGGRRPVLALDDVMEDSSAIWRALPELFWHYPVRRLKPAAEALLVHPTDRDDDGRPTPLLAAHDYGKGTVLFVGFDETWRWRYNEVDRYFGRFWSQAVYAAGVNRIDGTKLTQLAVDPPDPRLGSVGRVYARVYGPDLNPLTAGRVTARLERTDDRPTTLELLPLPGRPGEYAAPLSFDRIGNFALRVDAGTESATLEFYVGLPPGHERSPGGMAEAELRALAEGSGGRFYRESDLDALPDAVEPQTAPHTIVTEYSSRGWWGMAWVFGLLTAEWVLRKRSGLS